MNSSHLTEIAFVLDRSGSMASELEAAIAGFNKFLRDQQTTPGEARFTLVLFDDQYEIPCAFIPIEVAYKDEWHNLGGDYYTGKTYGSKSGFTEILTMGMERL